MCWLFRLALHATSCELCDFAVEKPEELKIAPEELKIAPRVWCLVDRRFKSLGLVVFHAEDHTARGGGLPAAEVGVCSGEARLAARENWAPLGAACEIAAVRGEACACAQTGVNA